METWTEPAARATTASKLHVFIVIIIIALAFLSVAAVNRLPVLFPDTLGYSSAGEAVLGVLGGHERRARHGAPTTTAAATTTTGTATTTTAAATVDAGVSAARSPYYGVFLAVLDRGGSVWLTAAAQAVVAATALVLALGRLRLTRTSAVAAGSVAAAAGLAFYACVLVPDVMLGPVILGLAFVLTVRDLPRGELAFWLAAVLAGVLFHRAFLAVAIVVVIAAACAWRTRWLVRRGWAAAAGLCVVAIVAHAAVGTVVEAAYGARMASQPFLLARMIEGRVVPAYLAEACPAKRYFLCRWQGRLPMDHDRFLWDTSGGGVFNTMTVGDKQRLNEEANAIVAGAVAARPVAALAEAIDYSVRSFLLAGMSDFAQRVPTRWRVDPPLAPAMAAYPRSGIVAGDFPLRALSAVTERIYLAALVAVAAAAALLALPGAPGRQRGAIDPRLVAAVAIIVGGIAVNAAVSGTLSGVRDRYTGRIAWLAPLAAAALIEQVRATARRRAP